VGLLPGVWHGWTLNVENSKIFWEVKI